MSKGAATNFASICKMFPNGALYYMVGHVSRSIVNHITQLQWRCETCIVIAIEFLPESFAFCVMSAHTDRLRVLSTLM